MISACLIVKNEDRLLQGCIDCLKKISDQIIIADTGSEDKTLSILENAGIEFFSIPWKHNFGDSRNQTIKLAKEPWILSFDADERIAEKDIETWKKAIAEIDLDPSIEAISIVRRNYIVNPSVSGFIPCKGEYAVEEENYPGYYEERMVRIFRNLPHIRWRGKLHEMIDPSLKGRVHSSQLIFHHYGYTPLEEKTRQKRQLYQNYGEQKIKENPNDWKAHLDLACEYIQSGQMQAAVDVLQKGRELNPHETKILANLGYALMELGRFEDSRRILDECLRIESTHHDGLMNLAVGFMRQKKFLQALSVFQSLLTKHPSSFLAYKNQGLCFLHLHNPAKGIEAFEKSIQLLPSYTDAMLDLAAAYYMNKNPQKALSLTEEAAQKDPDNPRVIEMLKHFRNIRHQSMG